MSDTDARALIHGARLGAVIGEAALGHCQPYKAARNRISGYSTATIGVSRTSRRPTSDAIQNGERAPKFTNATLAASRLLHRRSPTRALALDRKKLAHFRPSAGPFLQHNLPFWMASLVGHLLVLLIPIVAVLYPLMRFLPALYGWLMRRKIARLYGELRFLEDEITDGGGPTDAAQLMARLDQLEKQASQLRMSLPPQRCPHCQKWICSEQQRE